MGKLFVAVLALAWATTALAADVALKKTDVGVEVTLDGKPFTTYLYKSGAKPILWPILGPTGKEMTRAWPMREGDPTEKTDHVHQRSFWFTHGDVNGVSFWDENKGHGTIEHRELVKAEGGKTGLIVTKNDWLGPDGKKVCEDERRVAFGGDDDIRWIDFDVTVTADPGDVTFGNTKEGAFGLRIAESMRVDRKLGGKIINSEGQTDAAAWGKHASWVDYHGPVDGKTVGIAILNHPSSTRYPTGWHVRTYGLFAANPFGDRDFTGGKNVDGSLTIKKGDSFTLNYRVIFHRGDEKEGKIVERFNEYAKEKK